MGVGVMGHHLRGHAVGVVGRQLCGSVWWVINFVGHAVGVGDRVRGCGGWIMPWGLWFLADLGLLG